MVTRGIVHKLVRDSNFSQGFGDRTHKDKSIILPLSLNRRGDIVLLEILGVFSPISGPREMGSKPMGHPLL